MVHIFNDLVLVVDHDHVLFRRILLLRPLFTDGLEGFLQFILSVLAFFDDLVQSEILIPEMFCICVKGTEILPKSRLHLCRKSIHGIIRAEAQNLLNSVTIIKIVITLRGIRDGRKCPLNLINRTVFAQLAAPLQRSL